MPSVLFVCTANQIRSPFASALFQKLLKKKGYPLSEWRVSSAGTWVNSNLPPEKRMLSIAAELHIEIEHHPNVQINEQLIKEYNLVITMEKGQKEAIHYEFPQYQYKVHLLSEFGGQVFSVPDPHGMSPRNYRKILVELSSIIEYNFNSICNKARNLSIDSILY